LFITTYIEKQCTRPLIKIMVQQRK